MNYSEFLPIDSPVADHVGEKLVGVDLAINISGEVGNDAPLGKPNKRGEFRIGNLIPRATNPAL